MAAPASTWPTSSVTSGTQERFPPCNAGSVAACRRHRARSSSKEFSAAVFREIMDGFYGIIWALMNVIDGVLDVRHECQMDFCDEILFGHVGSRHGRLGFSGRKHFAPQRLSCARGRTDSPNPLVCPSTPSQARATSEVLEGVQPPVSASLCRGQWSVGRRRWLRGRCGVPKTPCRLLGLETVEGGKQAGPKGVLKLSVE